MWRTGLCVAIMAVLPGCRTGLIYTHITTPLDVNLNQTPVVRGDARGGVNTLQYYIRLDWGKGAIGEVALDHGFDTIHYADLGTLTILRVWTQRFVHVYGTRDRSAEDHADQR